MSRRPQADQQFGSDSFLDIVCNVVGILIILMVVAGVRASHDPVSLPVLSLPDNDEPRIVTAPAIEEELPPPPPMPIPMSPVPVIEPELPALPEIPAEPLPPLEPSPELVAAAEQLARELAGMDDKERTLQQQLANNRRQQQELEDRLQTLSKQQASQAAGLQAAEQQRQATAQELEQLRRIAAQLSQLVRERASEAPAAKTLEHRITPIGQAVTGKELHFRVLEDRISVVPLERLIERLKNQIDRHKEWIAKSRQQLGQVGPVEGYALHYVVQRESASVVDELRMGPGVFRINVTEWRVEAERDVETESSAEALRPGSRFLSAIATAEPGATLTFWVYPDSFNAYTEVKAYCQQQNFLIAGRPLPTGIPIAGSPNGTRSTGQ
ncbi:hypothetical protein GC163_04575 [bacterium]|nr:hypothetical protein [bacterium]